MRHLRTLLNTALVAILAMATALPAQVAPAHAPPMEIAFMDLQNDSTQSATQDTSATAVQAIDSRAAASVAAAPAPQPAARRGLPRASAELKTTTLSNGAVVEYREPTGADMERAHMAAEDGAGGEFALTLAVIAQVCTVDGEHCSYPDWRDARLADINQVMGAVMGNSPSSGLATSPVSAG